MRNKLITIALFIISGLNAQEYKKKYSDKYYPSANQLMYIIYSTDYNKSKESIEQFGKSENFFLINQNETKSTFHFEFKATEKDLARIDSFCNKIGYVSSKNLNSYNNESKLSEARIDLERLEKSKLEYEKMLNRPDFDKTDKFYQHWEKIREIETEIYNEKTIISQLESVKNLYSITIDLYDEEYSPTNKRISFIHMPGVEYQRLFIENPLHGTSFAVYEGYYLRYLFTKGKDYFSLGALKSVDSGKDTLAFDEMFTFTFGQDWYSKHFGRGKYKFFNPYIGYQIGCAIAYKNRDVEAIPFVSPETGLELFKNKYLLVDVNVNYFLPVSKYNKNMRGWLFGSSFNFAF